MTAPGDSRPTPAPPQRPFGWIVGDWDRIQAEAGDGAVAASICALGQGAQPEDLAAVLDEHRGTPAEDLAAVGLAASIYNSFGRLQLLLDDPAGARESFRHAIDLLFDAEGDSASELEVEARSVEQARRLGIARIWAPEGTDALPLRTDQALTTLGEIAPDDAPIVLALAERCQSRGEYRAAIQHWQNLAGAMGALMPQSYYARLQAAYVAQGSFPVGEPEEEALKGAIDKYDALKTLHEVLRPRLYVEIGVQHGRSLRLAKGRAIGIDPMPIIKAALSDRITLFEMSADAFFFGEAWRLRDTPPDLVFIDGMHLFEYALRDFINIEAHSTPNTVVVIDDIYPNHSAQAARVRRTRGWTGDVWKLQTILEQRRPDLTLTTIDVYPTGLLMIQGLDSRSRLLSDSYDSIIDQFADIETVPDPVLQRTGVHITSIDQLAASVEHDKAKRGD